ncbi:MAG TPA: hypothetical protein VI386_08435 [Candidatus Sulfotelmatobacter sp.]
MTPAIEISALQDAPDPVAALSWVAWGMRLGGMQLTPQADHFFGQRR